MTTPTGSTVVANVRAEAARRGLTQGDLAAVLGVSRSAMSRRLTGDMQFDVDELQKLADHFSIEPADLLRATARTQVSA